MPSSPPPEPPAPSAPPVATLRFRLGALGLAIALIAIGAIVFLVTRSDAEPQRTNPQVSTAGVATVGEQAPGFLMPNLSSGARDVQFNPGGKPTVLTFWASWCAPCRKEFPLLRDAQAANPDLAVLGVVYKDIPADARAFVQEMGTTWPNGTDQGGEIAGAYGVRAIPQIFFIDRTGVIRARAFGITTKAALDKELAKIR